ncbi:MAG: class I SAM-dependent methyltransferase [Chloroflexi bacterium]|nr:class I SAM-dependent methyltransferase [Chloroflexota bacterium]
MNDSEHQIEDIRAYWNSRAGLAQWAGTRDIIAKQLEIEAISRYVRNGMHILEVGCGNGITVIEIAKRYDVNILGIDYAEEMIVAAQELIVGQELRGQVTFQVGDVRKLSSLGANFDLIYTERVLINLPDWEAQKQAITDICSLLYKGGVYVMCENSQDGLESINELREKINLPTITPPWHNRYFRDSELAQLVVSGVQLEGINFYSSTYYFLSRVVNAWLANYEGEEPEYEAPVNQLALQLPAVGQLGQGRIWLWRKIVEDGR